MPDRKFYTAVVGLTSLGAVITGCDSSPKPCEDNNIQFYIPGSLKDVAALKESLETSHVEEYELSVIKDINGFFEKIGNTGVAGATLYRPGTAALIDITIPFAEETASLSLLTEKNYEEDVVDNIRYRGLLTWGERSDNESLDIKITRISTSRGNEALPNLDSEGAGKEVLMVSFGLGNLPYNIDELGKGSFQLIIERVDCNTLEANPDSRQVFRVSAPH